MKLLSNYQLSVGVDIEQIKRFDLDGRKTTFLEKIYTSRELNYCFSKKNFAQHLALRFAGKEAVYKAISGAKIKPFLYNAIEINKSKSGVPQVKFLNKELKNIKVALSLSHSADEAIAFAVVLKK